MSAGEKPPGDFPRAKSVLELIDEHNAQLVRDGGAREALDRLGAALTQLANQFGTEVDQRAHDELGSHAFDWTYHGADRVRRDPFRAYEDLRALLGGRRLPVPVLVLLEEADGGD